MIACGNPQTFEDRLEHYRSRVAGKIRAALDADDGIPSNLVEAIDYSVLGPGKRIRPLLTYAIGELFDLEPEPLDAIAAAVELIHAYSLVHDDLPAMDDDDLRRGRPTTHRAFGEAVAILAGDGLQALAFEILCCDERLTASPAERIKIITWLARAAGPAGMVGGQTLDLQAEGKQLDEAALENIHRRKTGELIRASIMMPVELARPSELPTEDLDRLATDIGLLFQIRDDLLEIEQDTATLGKSSTSDQENEKSTYPSVLGIEGARQRALALYTRVNATLDTLPGDSSGLRWVVDYIYGRSN
ncbi:MAG: polyprenyl synthetase family protein [Gammaproteobacteria bacterium]|nr:polyprenyl synthetase family protein [Gammaproteobacteria bacterium]